MNTGRIIRARFNATAVPTPESDQPVAAGDTGARRQMIAERLQAHADRRPRTISGHVLATIGNSEVPVADARVELLAVSPLATIAAQLSAAVFDHLRALLLERPTPHDLYRGGGHVVDAPNLSFADIMLLREMPGFELLRSAAKLQGDTSLRQMLCNNPAILRPLLCYYHPQAFTAKCVATAQTNHQGAFTFPVLKFANVAEQPGYSFIVRRHLSEHLFATLYEPTPIAWHTRWDSSDDDDPICLHTRHPLAARAYSGRWQR